MGKDERSVNNAVMFLHGGNLIEEDEVECRPECIPRKCLDDNVCIKSESISLLMRGTYLKPQWKLCVPRKMDMFYVSQ